MRIGTGSVSSIGSASAVAAVAMLLSACGSAGGSDSGPAREVSLTAVDFAFEAEESITIAAGDTVTFNVRNEGTFDHELEVLRADNRSLGKTERIAPGALRSVTVTFEQAGNYRVICDIDDHLSKGQQANFEVVDGG